MKKFLTDKYVVSYLIVYLIFLFLLKGDIALGELVALMVVIGFIFTTIAYFLTKSATPLFCDKPSQNRENVLLISLILWLIVFLTYYKDLIQILNNDWGLGSTRLNLWDAAFKLIFLVIIPILVYNNLFRFRLKEWGILDSHLSYFSRKSIFIFVVFAVIIILVQYMISNGFKPVKAGHYTTQQILIGLPLNFIWLLITVGVVEEFFFRAFLQSRISVLLKSQTGGIIISATIFGLAHAPGIFLRGGGEIANLGSEPSLLLSIGYSFVTLSVAGFFLSVIWLRTKNFWLIAAIHATVDLLPSLSKFIDTWGL